MKNIRKFNDREHGTLWKIDLLQGSSSSSYIERRDRLNNSHSPKALDQRDANLLEVNFMEKVNWCDRYKHSSPAEWIGAIQNLTRSHCIHSLR